MKISAHGHLGIAVATLVSSLWIARPANAQFAVIDVASVAQLVQQAETLAQQLEQARQQVIQAQSLYQSLTGPRGMQLLLGTTVRNYLPTSLQQLSVSQLGGGPYPALASDIRAAVSANAVLTPAQLATLPPTAQMQISASRNNVALLQALAQEALSNSSTRFDSIQQLIQAIPTAVDQKGILDLQARIGAEQGMLQNEQTKLQTLFQAAQAQAGLLKQRSLEQTIEAYGTFSSRFEPTP